MSFSLLLSAIIAGCPLLFLPSYISERLSFPKPLSPAEEMKYLEQYKNGDEKAKDILIERNMRLVAHISRKYSNTNIDQDDLISIGTMGLIKSIETFRAERNVKLATYAARCVENEILMHLRKVRNERTEVSINEPLGIDREGNEISFNDILATEHSHIFEILENKMRVAELYAAIESELTSREKTILTYRFGLANNEELTQREIAERLGISRSYVSRIEKKALHKLHRAFMEKDI